MRSADLGFFPRAGNADLLDGIGAFPQARRVDQSDRAAAEIKM